MLLIHTVVLGLLPFLGATPAEAQQHDLNRAFGNGEAQRRFQELLENLPAESLHTALHTHLEPKYKDGVYENDRTAVAKVHAENPTLASRLIAAAHLDFVKRQADNSTTTVTTTDDNGSTTTSTTTITSSTPPPPTTSPTSDNGGSVPSSTTQDGGGAASQSPTPQSSPQDGSGGTTTPGGGSGDTSSTPVVIPVQITTTDGQGQTVVSSTSAVLASPTVSAVVPTTITGSDGSTTVSSATVAGAVIETTNAAGQTVQSTIPVSSFRPQTTAAGRINTIVTNTDGLPITLTGVTSGQVIRTTDAQGHTFVTTFTPGGGRISEIVFKTSTNAQGQPMTLTSFVAAPSVVESSGGSDSPSNTRNPSLQSGLAVQPAVGRELLLAVGAGILGAAAMV